MDGAKARKGGGTPRRALLRGDLPDSFARSLYRIAPYRGCAHACAYCDGRAERYYVEGDYERDIVARTDTPSSLERELGSVREGGMVCFSSGTTDPYQPLELELGLTGKSLALLAARAAQAAEPALAGMAMTKSSHVLRDLSSWRALAAGPGALVLISLASLDEGLREAMEGGASPFAERLAAARALKAAGCHVGILAMPLLPGLSDGDESIRALYAACAEAGADFVMPGGLTLRPGRQKDFYMARLAAYRPDLVPLTERLYAEDRPSGSPIAQYRRDLMSRIAPIRRASGLPWLLPHEATAGLMPPHDAFHVLLLDMAELYAERGVDTRALRASLGRYDAWLIGIKRIFRRKRSLPASWLPERFQEAVDDGRLEDVLGNARLWAFARAVLREGARLDYRELRLVRG